MLHMTQLGGWSGGSHADDSVGGGVCMVGVSLYRNATLTGSALSKLCTFSCWFRRVTYGRNDGLFFITADWTGLILAAADDKLYFSASPDGTTVSLNINSSIAVPRDRLWHHIAFSYSLSASSVCRLYLDGVDRLVTVTALNQNVDWRAADFIIGNNWMTSTWQFYGCLAEFYLNTKEYVDLSVPANLAMFRTAAGKPAELGDDGSRPTGNRPLVYQRHVNGVAGSDFQTNRGTGGGLTRGGPVPWQDPMSPSSTWNQVFGCIPTTDGGGDYTAYTTRQNIPASMIYNLPPGRTQARVALSGLSASALTIGKCYIGHQTGGQAWDASDLVQITFNGGSPSVTIPANGTIVSDAVNWIYTGGTILVNFYFTAAADLIMSEAVGSRMYWKAGDDAATLNAAGYAVAANVDICYVLMGIEMV